MTAFGRSKRVTEDGTKCVTVEIRSVNNRFLDLSVRVPRSYSFLEERIRGYISERGITRGKVDVNLSVDVLSSGDVGMTLDEGMAGAYLEALKKLRDRFGLPDDISTMSVAQNRDLFLIRSADEDEDASYAQFLPIIREAVDGFLDSREREGQRLKEDLLSKIERLGQYRDEVEKLSEGQVDAYAEKLEAKIREILDRHELVLDEGRILTEVGIYADRVAVDEELARLSSHLAGFREILDGDEPAGRKLDFLVQEINREINTVGSKASETKIARTVVEMKTLLEKIREQIQNLE